MSKERALAARVRAPLAAALLAAAMGLPQFAYGYSPAEKIDLERLALESSIAIGNAQGQKAPEPPSKTLRLGDAGPEVQKLKAILRYAMPFAKVSAGDVFDKETEAAVIAAQEKFSLTADGVAGKKTYAALGMTSKEKLERIIAYQKIWADTKKKAEEQKAGKYLVVNIPSFSVKAVEGGIVKFESKAVVGRPTRQTPLGMIKIHSLKVNPEWTPPPGILKKDVYPAFARNDLKWLRDHGLELRRPTGERLDFEAWDLAGVLSENLRFVQPSGDRNALGLMKFETDSKNNIYLHDTNERYLFGMAMRAKSSGCVRVEKWMEIAAWASDRPTEDLQKKVAEKKTKYLKIKEPVPVFTIYSLADLVDGEMRFPPDVYKGAPAKEAGTEDDLVRLAYIEAQKRKKADESPESEDAEDLGPTVRSESLNGNPRDPLAGGGPSQQETLF